jgi:hypothetical protein
LTGSGTEDTTKRRTALTLGLVAALSPDTLTSVLHDSAGEAMEFTRSTAVSSVGAGTLDHLEAVVTDLDRSYWAKPPGELFVVARAYRQRVDQLIQGRHTLREERELYFYAAWLSELLALLAHDFGFPLAAEAYAIDCYEHADQAGQDVLCAWATETIAHDWVVCSPSRQGGSGRPERYRQNTQPAPFVSTASHPSSLCPRSPRSARRVCRAADRSPRTARSTARQIARPTPGR